MPKRLPILLLILSLQLPVFPQSSPEGDEKVEGWDFVVLPAVSFNTDLGLHYGLFGNFYYYGRDSLCTYPLYRHRLSFEGSRYTCQQTLGYLQYDGIDLLPGVDVSVTGRWQLDPKFVFWGYNGIPLANRHGEGASYYFFYRRYLMFDASTAVHVAPWLKVYAGITLYDYKIKESAEEGPNLWREYRTQGLIRDEEALGGSHLDLKVGLLHDSRNHPTIPSRGYKGSLLLTLRGEPNFHFSMLNLQGSLAQFYPLGNRMVFANCIAAQTLVAGEQPYYLLSSIATTEMSQAASEGLGGVTTLRGLPLNTLVGNGMAWMNTELRIRLFDTELWHRHVEVAVVPFVDAGTVFQPYRLDLPKTSIYTTAGLGGKMIVNQNFVLSAEAGWLLWKINGETIWSLNISTGYIF